MSVSRQSLPSEASPPTDSPPRGSLRQTMSWLHTWAGLALGWVMYFIFITGTAGYFDTEIDQWMQPELPPSNTSLDTTATSAMMLARLQTEAPMASRWYLTIPAGRQQAYPNIFWQDASLAAGASSARGSLTLDGSTGAMIEGRDTGGGQLLYRMHWKLHYLPHELADVIVGLATLFMLVALVTGIIIHKKFFIDFFTFRAGKGQRSWLDAHNVLSVIALPFHLMITYSGLIFMGFSYMPLIVAAHYGIDSSEHRQFTADVFDPPGLVEAANQAAPLTALEPLVAEVENRWGEGRIRGIDIRHPGDRNARIIFYEHNEQSIFSGAERLVYDGVGGKLLHSTAPTDAPAKGVREAFVGLHEGQFAPPLLRWLYFFSGLLGSGMIATGLILWTVKRRQRLEKKQRTPHPGLRLVERLNIANIVGLPAAIAAYFWANRLLPLEMAERSAWEAHVMFLVWLALVLHALFRPTARAWMEQLAIAALAYGLLPVLNAITTQRHLGQSLATGDWVFAGFDLTVLAIGLCLAATAWRLYRKQAKPVLSDCGDRSELPALGERS